MSEISIDPVEAMKTLAIVADEYLKASRFVNHTSCDREGYVEIIVPIRNVQQLWYAVEICKQIEGVGE